MKKSNNGFTLVETMVVTSVLIAMIVIGASTVSHLSASRRSVDNITNALGTTLQLAKLKASKLGVEHRVVIAACNDIDDDDPSCVVCENVDDYENFTDGDEELNIILERGSSNINSDTWCIQTIHNKPFNSGLTFTASDNISDDPLSISLAPTGMRSDSRNDANIESLTILPDDDAKVDKCGQIAVTASGRISVIQGRWDGDTCNAILDL